MYMTLPCIYLAKCGYFLQETEDNCMSQSFFEKISRILGEGGKLKIINRKGVELDLNLEFKSANIEYNIEADSYEKKIAKLERQKKKMIEELAQLKLELERLKPIKKLREDYLLKTQLYDRTTEGQLVKRATQHGIKDIDAIVNDYDESRKKKEKLQENFDLEMRKSVVTQESSESIQLDNLTEYYRDKFK